MLEELGGFFGWLLALAFAGTVMNYFIKFVNKRFNKNIASNPALKKIMKVLMLVFVRNHRYFGLAAIIFLVVHFLIQFAGFGLNITGSIAAILIIVQVLLGFYAYIKKIPRKGRWFIIHRVISALIVIGIAVHLAMPYAWNLSSVNDVSNQSADAADSSTLKGYTLDELSKYNGQNGNKAYITYNGMVYDVTDVAGWEGGMHHGQKAGSDLTGLLSTAPHGVSVLDGLKVVGKLI